MQELQNIYLGFLNLFPGFLHPFISIGLAVFIVYSAFQVVQRNFIYIVVLVILLPASIPILRDVVDAVVGFIKFVLRI
jgi:hypothetical protein